MTENNRTSDAWRIPSLVLWWIFLTAGVFPEEIFNLARQHGRVLTQDALVNSPILITLSFAAYVGFFAYRACRDNHLPLAVCQGRAIQLAIVGLITFLPFPLSLLTQADDILVHSLKVTVYLVWGSKFIAWVYLGIFFFRLYGRGNTQALTAMLDVFPSAHLSKPSEASESIDGNHRYADITKK